MTELNRIYRLTAIRAPDTAAIEGFDRSFFEELETITEITGLDISFRIEKHLGKQPNTAEIEIVNAGPVTRAEFTRGTPIKIRFEAGHDQTLRPLFVGDLRYASDQLDGTEWRTKLQLADGGRAYAEARINRSYAPKTSIETILRDLAKAFGAPLPQVSEELKQRVASGEMLLGYASDELTRVLAQFNYEWSFQDGKLQILRSDESRAGVVRVISQDDGMLGSPTIEPPKITATKKSKKAKVPKLTVRHTLFPELVPGERFDLESRSIRGRFRIDALTHEGDTAGSDWITTIEAIEI